MVGKLMGHVSVKGGGGEGEEVILHEGTWNDITT